MNKTIQINWQKGDGLVPAIIQDHRSKAVLMLGYMNAESLDATSQSGRVTFYSRTRQALWVKGKTSGNFFDVVEIKPDCDQDALLILVNPVGPACHRDTETCFDGDFDFLIQLEQTIQDRIDHPNANSYTSRLLQEGLDRVIQKVGEEGVECVIAAKNEDLDKLEGEAADLLFHLMVMLRAKKTSLIQVMSTLIRRHRK